MKLAIMQPYLFPYIGYFQLIHSVDHFILLDDVNFINKGWINRNYILSQSPAGNSPDKGGLLFTLPLEGASQNKKINEIKISAEKKPVRKFLSSLEQIYRSAPHFKNVFPLIQSTFNNTEADLVNFLLHALQSVMGYSGISTKISRSSEVENEPGLRGQDRIMALCDHFKATHYINPSGGTELYDPLAFKNKGIELSFLKVNSEVHYPQFGNEFVQNLSIIDMMMFVSPEMIGQFLQKFDLFKNERAV